MVLLFSPLKTAIKWLLNSAFKGFGNMVKDSVGLLTGTEASWIIKAKGMVLTISDALNPFCQTIIALCLLIELAQTTMKVDMLKWEHGLKVCIKMVLAKVCIDVAPDFLWACYLQAGEWISSIGGNVEDLRNLCNQFTRSAYESLDGVSGAGAILSLFLSSLFILVAIKICGLLIKVIAFGRMFEILVYLAISPLPCAFFPLGDGAGGGISRITQKFFKSFIAVSLQGVMMLVCIKVYNIIIETILSTPPTATDAAAQVSELCYVMLMGSIVLVMSVARCGSWAKSIIDAM